MQFSRLRLSGFKSFVDPTELKIEPGLTGIVGPNGCGKSNLVEALRWVMGENSPKSMRGAGMDDVIFAGTQRRPARNLAEVSLLIDNERRQAPAAFNDEAALEITRRIERDSGSAYRINGRDVRAKDVQLLFADAATGAHSPALVSQGRVGALINAKPKDRRAILEDAAGISGLHARRKEAEQRLRGAEGNLVRLQDVLAQLESQIAGLKRQARQAARYRNLSGDIRRTEAAILYLRWRAAAEDAVALETELREAERLVADRTGKVSALSTEQADLSARLPDLRKAEAKAAAAVQRLSIARETMETEERRRRDSIAKLIQSREQIAADKTRESESRQDAAEALARLDKERERLDAAGAADAESESRTREQLDQAAQKANAAEAAFDALSQSLVEARGRRASLSSDLAAIARRMERLALDKEAAARAIEALAESDESASPLTRAQTALDERIAQIDAGQTRLAAAERRTAAAREARDAARADLSAARSDLASVEAEIAALEKRLAAERADGHTPVADRIAVAPGYEVAVGAALGSDLEAPEDADAPIRWSTLPTLEGAPPLPAGLTPLTGHVTAPKALARRLAFIGVAEDEAALIAVGGRLAPGQRAVGKAGAMIRWDGLVTAAEAPSAAALRLQQKNKLEALRRDALDTRRLTEGAERRFAQAQKACDDAEAGEAKARTAQREAERSVAAARRALAEAEQAASRRASKLAGLQETAERLKRDLDDAEARQAKTAAAIAALPDIAALEGQLSEKRAEVEMVRRTLADARAAYDARRREAEARRERLAAIGDERAAWTRRQERADAQIAQLDERDAAAQAELAALEVSPDALEAKRQALLEELTQAEAARTAAADALAAAESALAARDRALKSAQESLAGAREARVRAEAALEAAEARRKELAAACGQRFQCPPTHLLSHMEAGEPDALPPLAELERKQERLKAERERLGAVNLRAEEELAEVEEQLEHLLNERRDLEGAIARLRQAISGLNREGRQRLLAAFDEVNRHFADLFETLFGGGRAHLELVESDDPLDAGIEIMASPPGKRLQILSLLSGGEQALTALSLIFAVFMTNPSPICVLDEVDAPLDEANVERFCDLLDGMIARTQTRFLLVTHNEVTMARMHRLFGVTMAERGVSQLVSVDLERAEELVAAE